MPISLAVGQLIGHDRISSVPLRFEPLELHVVDALGQQEVPDYFQQPAKAISEDVSVLRGPYALEWI